MNKELALRVILKGEARIKQLEEEKAENEALVQKLIEKIQYVSRLAEIDDVTGMADQRVNSDGELDPATGQIEEVKRLEAGMAEKDVVIERLTRENVELEEEKTRNKVEIQKLLEENDKCYETLKKAQNVIAKMMPYVEKGVATTEAGQQEELVPAEDNTAYVEQIKKLAGKETKMKTVIERLTEEKQELADRLECSELAKALVDQKMASETAQQELGQARDEIRGLTSMVQEHKEEKEAWKVEEKLESSASSEQSKDLSGRPEETEENIQEAALEHSWKELELDTYSMPCEDLDEFDLDEEAVDWEDCETNW